MIPEFIWFSRLYTLKTTMRETTQNQTKAIDVSVLFKCILVVFCGKYFGTRKALRMYEAKHTERSRALAKTLG